MKRLSGPTLAGFGALMMFALSSPTLGQATGQASSAAPGTAASAASASAPAPAIEQGLFARVNSRRVTQGEFHAAFGAYLRTKYYHGRVPDEDLLKAREVVTDHIVNSILLSEESTRRGIQPNREEVDRRVNAFEQQNARSPEWQRDRDRVLPELRSEVEDQVRVAQLETQVRDAVRMTPDEVRAFYLAKPELFTEPERLRVHAILLGVDPSSSVSVWNAAIAEAEAIVRRIRGGANFADIARMVSSDPSSAQGGDMGYVHMGMLPEAVQGALGSYKNGEVGEPVRVLEGIGIFRVDERTPATLRDYEQVKERAQQLAMREKRDQVWKDFVASLRKNADVVIAEGRPAAVKTPNQ